MIMLPLPPFHNDLCRSLIDTIQRSAQRFCEFQYYAGFEARVHRPSSVSYMCKINASAQLTVDKYTIAAYNAYPSSFCTRTHTHIISLKTQTRQDMRACNFAYIRTCHSSIYLAHIFAMFVAMRALHRGRCRRRRCRAAATSQLLHRYTI